MAFNIFIFKQSDWKIWIAGQRYLEPRVESVYGWGLEEKADLCFNLGFFDMRTHLSCTYARNRYGDISYGGEDYCNLVVLNGQNWCRGYANAIIDGDIHMDTRHFLGGRDTYRNGIGLTSDNQVIIAQSSHKCSESAFIFAVNNFVKARGLRVQVFVLEDGGGSVSEWSFRADLGFYPSEIRKVATVVCAKYIGKPYFPRTLSKGCRGEDVRLLQTVLGGIEADGIFGAGTRARVIAAQRQLKIQADGYAGPITISKLFR